MALTVRARQSAHAAGATVFTEASPSPLAVQSGDTLYWIWVVEADAAVTSATMGTQALAAGAESVAPVFVSASTIETIVSVYSLVLFKLTVTSDLATAIVDDTGWSFSGTGPTLVGPSSISHIFSGCWWVDTDGAVPSFAAGTADATAPASTQTASDSLSETADSGGFVLVLAGVRGPTTDNGISALTMAWTNTDGSSSLSRTAGGGVWRAASVAETTGTGGAVTPTMNVDTNDADDDIDLLVIAAAQVEAAAVATDAGPTYQLSPAARKVFVKELPFGVHTGMVGGIQPGRRILDNTRKQRDDA